MLEVSTLVVASHNAGKVREIGELLAPYGIETLSAGEMGVGEPVEDGSSFSENATIKAVACRDATGLPSLSDDSGFSVRALGGKPGIYAADWAELPAVERAWSGQRRDFNMAMWHVRRLLAAANVRPDTPEAAAHFTCALCLAVPGEAVSIYEGRCEGTVTWPPRGGRGFGYDPIFVAHSNPAGDGRTFGEIDPAEKHARSHRADAFAKLMAAEFART